MLEVIKTICLFINHVFLFLFIFLAIFYALKCLEYLGGFILALRDKTLQEAIKLKEENEGTTSSAMDQFNFSVGILDLLDRMIVIEIEKVIAGYAQLGKRYETQRLDIDIKHISEVVSKAIRPEVFISSDMIIEPTYIMNTITERTTHLLIESIKEYNRNFISVLPMDEK